MGQCGCGDGFGDFRIPGPEGTTYTVRTYRPCSYCETPGAVILERHRGDLARNSREIPEVEWVETGDDYADAWFPLFHPLTVKAAIVEASTGMDVEDEDEIDDITAEVIADEAIDLLMRRPAGWMPKEEA